MRVIRDGAQATVHWCFFKWWRRAGKRRGYDLVVDVVNTIPFFTPLFIRGGQPRRIALFFQLARRIWWFESRLPFSLIGFLVEPLYVRVYRRTHVITISESSLRDLAHNGIPERLISICPVGIDVQPLEALEPKAAGLDIVFVGRLTASKRPDDIVRAFLDIRRSRPEARLRMVGDGRQRYKDKLFGLVREFGLEGEIDFRGWVSNDEKLRLMRESHVIAVTSVKEGWGLIVTEAAALGTPAVVYDIDGLRDSVRDGETGVVCKENTPGAMAREILSLTGEPERYERLRTNALEWSRAFTWDRTAQEFKTLTGIE